MVDPNIDAVAKAAGVHRSTVSRAFSRPEAVNPKTREHILRVADELGYTMSPLARALSSKASAFIPLIVPDIVNPFYAELATSMIQTADERGYQLVVCTTNGDNRRTAGYLVAMQSLYAPFGIIAPSTRVDIETLTQYGFGSKVVILDQVAPGAELPSIAVDNRRGIELAFEHLRSLGHERIGYVSGISGAYTVQERLSAYEDLAAGDSIILDNGSDRGAGERAAAHFVKMRQRQRPTAIIAGNDMTAFALISTLAEEGVDVPRDVSVVGFDGLDFGARFNPRLTTIRQPIADLGSFAIDLAEKKAADGSAEHIVLAPELLVRASTAGPRT